MSAWKNSKHIKNRFFLITDKVAQRDLVAARAGGYYREAFKGARGVTQGDPLSPTIFNVVVDAVVRHWLEGLQTAKEEKGAKWGGHLSAVFYADDGMVGASDPE